jgi:uncharacterized protein (DUF1778 family)
MGKKERRTSRVNMRLTPENLAVLRAGAQVQHQDLTAFVLGTALERAHQLLKESHDVTGSVGLAAFE